MMTIRGDIPEALLRRETTTEAVPCGKCRTTTYYASDGGLVRQDIEILVDSPPIITSEGGTL